jgi:hypothetical protein
MAHHVDINAATQRRSNAHLRLSYPGRLTHRSSASTPSMTACGPPWLSQGIACPRSLGAFSLFPRSRLHLLTFLFLFFALPFVVVAGGGVAVGKVTGLRNSIACFLFLINICRQVLSVGFGFASPQAQALGCPLAARGVITGISSVFAVCSVPIF